MSTNLEECQQEQHQSQQVRRQPGAKQSYPRPVDANDIYRLPEYRHDAPWPRPRPRAEVAARTRAARQGRAERGTSTAADARADLEEKVSTYLSGVVPEEYCRDAPPVPVAVPVPRTTDRQGRARENRSINAARCEPKRSENTQLTHVILSCNST